MTGFPPPRERQVDVSNWLQPQNVRWAFRHMREIMPTQLISAGTGGSGPLPTTDTELGNPVVVGVDGSSSTVEEIFAGTFTDAGADVVTAHDLRTALEAATNRNVSAAILDVPLGGADSGAVLRRTHVEARALHVLDRV